ncbi:MAG: NUDIX domain-containing protein [bacterium]|nr:NUDIX domain-containing protein [bacterium]
MKTKTEISAGGIVYKKDKLQNTLWLICQHSQHKGWVFPKGLIGDETINETKEQAAIREVEEEGGVKTKIVYPKPIIIHFDYQWNGSPHAKDNSENILINKTVYYYLMEYIFGNPKNHDWEMSDAKFVTQQEAFDTLTYSSDKEAFIKILEIYNKK